MTPTVLITTFDVWKPHHVSNSSDDLVAAWVAQNQLDSSIHLLRKLPVDFQLAPEQVIATLNELQPHFVVCCGMAERRSRLSVESNGTFEAAMISTPVDVRSLVQDLTMTRVSHNAGRFVCNHLYHSVLNYVQSHRLNTACLFIHVPPLNSENQSQVLHDFSTILTRLIAC